MRTAIEQFETTTTRAAMTLRGALIDYCRRAAIGREEGQGTAEYVAVIVLVAGVVGVVAAGFGQDIANAIAGVITEGFSQVQETIGGGEG